MKNMLLILVFGILSISLSAQYMVGFQYMSFYDESRDRDISTTVYYPSEIGGEDADISSGTFPAVIFGHGTAMSDEVLYDYITEELASSGYIVLFPTTEGDSPPLGAPDHEDFGLDLQYLNLVIKAENTNATSFFYGHVTDKTAIMGHSLGGKGTLIAASNNTEVTTIITLCAALSDPPWPYDGNGYDVINNSMPNITVPSLVVDAEFDCVVEDGYGKYVTYELLTNVNCKTYVNIVGGGHCYMASSDGTCETAEGWLGGNCSGDFTISREEQNNTVLDIIMPYLDYYLKENENSMSEFLCYLETTTDVTSERLCDLPDAEIEGIDIYSNVENVVVPYNTTEIDAIQELAQDITISDIYGVEQIVPLDWSISSYNQTVTGDYNATGIFMLPQCVSQTDPATPLQVSAIVTVDESVMLNTLINNDISFYPNPVNDVLHYSIVDMGNTKDIYIYDSCGKLVLKENANQKGKIDLKDITSGIYILTYNGISYKLIIE